MNKREKGKRVERLIVNWLKERGVASAHRTQQYCGVSEGGMSDIQAPTELPTWHLECKGTKNPTVPECILKEWDAQLARDCPAGKTPVILHKPNGHKLRALMRICDFFKKECSHSFMQFDAEDWLKEIAGFSMQKEPTLPAVAN